MCTWEIFEFARHCRNQVSQSSNVQDEEAEVQRGLGSWPRSHRWKALQSPDSWCSTRPASQVSASITLPHLCIFNHLTSVNIAKAWQVLIWPILLKMLIKQLEPEWHSGTRVGFWDIAKIQFGLSLLLRVLGQLASFLCALLSLYTRWRNQTCSSYYWEDWKDDACELHIADPSEMIAVGWKGGPDL